MPRFFDIRLRDDNQSRSDPLEEVRRAAVAVSDALPGQHRLVLESVDDRTGNAELIRSVGASPAGGDLTAAALEHLDRVREVIGLADHPGAWVDAPRTTLTTSSGATAVHLHQSVSDIPVFQAVRTVVFAPDRTVRTTAGVSFTPTPGAPTEPAVSPVDGVLIAARHLGGPSEPGDPPVVDLAAVSPAETVVTGGSLGPTRRTTVTAPPFDGPVEVSLLWFDVHAELRLAWEVMLALPDGADHYQVIVDAQTADVLLSRPTTLHVAARGNVALPDPRTPRQMWDFPMPLNAYPVGPHDIPENFLADWVTVDSTVGDNTQARLIGPPSPAAVGAEVDGIMTFDAPDAAGNDQLRVAAFLLCNYMHDLLYLLGFREDDGNFGAGVRRDEVLAFIHPTPVAGTANMNVASTDGSSPIMSLGPFPMVGGRHTALDAGMVFHEYTHGLVARLVGGRNSKDNLVNIQSGSLNEGWSDYFACTLTNSVVFCAWVSSQTGGFRGFPYDEAYPDHFGLLGTGRYTEVHNNGEVWCAALMELNRRLGVPLALQLVVDALKMTPANPSYTQARDGIIYALRDKHQAEQWESAYAERTHRQAWRAFARFGLGNAARGGSSSDYSLVRGDFTVPAYPATIYAITENDLDPVTGQITPAGNLLWYRHDGRPHGHRQWTTANRPVGGGWDFSHVFGGGEGIVYAITESTVDPMTGQPRGGDLLWYRHDGWRTGTKGAWTVMDRPISRKWGSYRHIFSGGDGIIYAVNDDGDVLWRRHDGWRDGTDAWTAPADERLAGGWDYGEVFSGGNGVLYAVTPRTVDPATGQRVGGDLVWFRHDGWRTGSNRWAPDGGRIVYRRWNAVQTFSGGDGVIYARQENGDLNWFRHDGWHNGSDTWAPGSGNPVGSGWAFKQVFAS